MRRKLKRLRRHKNPQHVNVTQRAAACDKRGLFRHSPSTLKGRLHHASLDSWLACHNRNCFLSSITLCRWFCRRFSSQVKQTNAKAPAVPAMETTLIYKAWSGHFGRSSLSCYQRCKRTSEECAWACYHLPWSSSVFTWHGWYKCVHKSSAFWNNWSTTATLT